MKREVRTLDEAIANLILVSDVVEGIRKKFGSSISVEMYEGQKHLVTAIEQFKASLVKAKKEQQTQIQPEDK